MIYTDGLNHYIGNCIYANHDINYRTLNFLQASPHSSIASDLEELCVAAGLQLGSVAPQEMHDSDFSILNFSSASDSVIGRFSFNKVNSVETNPDGVSMYGSGGYEPTDNSISTTNEIFRVSDGSSYPNRVGGNDEVVQWCGVANSEALALFCYSISKSDPSKWAYHFWYAGTFADINTNLNYYSNNQQTKSATLFLRNTSTGPSYSGGKHFIDGSAQNLLQTGRAIQSIACSNLQTQVSPWARDFYAYDSNTSLGNPIIGRFQHLTSAQGLYTIGKPVVFSTPRLDGGINRWMPVGAFAEKTILMRCYQA